jgi:MFS-type transporter involved in bile tolerance (Atg22 family)
VWLDGVLGLALLAGLAVLAGPLLFTGAAALFGASRPAVLGLGLLFVAGIVLLLRVKVREGRAAARAEGEALP